MELNTLLLILAVLACPFCIGVMMSMMHHNTGRQHDNSMSDHGEHVLETDRLGVLCAQRQLLEQEIAEVEKIVALEAKKHNLVQNSVFNGVGKE